MAIDARIDAIEKKGAHLILHLQPTIHSDGQASIRGQTRLRIVNATHRPRIGQIIWGGSGIVIIEPGFGEAERREYDRIGYTKLKERR